MNTQMKEIHRVRSRRVLSTGASLPKVLGVPPCQHVDIFINSKSHTSGIFMETSSHGHDWLLTRFPAPSTLWRIGSRAGGSKLLIMAWSFW